MDFFSLNEEQSLASKPLADKLRPKSLQDFLGQKKIVGENSLLLKLIKQDKLCSMIFWGPPGSGKTTLAMLIARMTKSEFISLSAVTSGVKEVKAVIEKAKVNLYNNLRTILFVDEIHRFNKAQQDAFLPHVENGTIVLIGATTENPSFSIISPLLSRCKVFTLFALSEGDIRIIMERAVNDEKDGYGSLNIKCEEGVYEAIAALSDGDARRALNLLELCVLAVKPDKSGVINITKAIIKDIIGRDHFIYDKKGEEHYNLISALHKSLRGSDPQAAAYWLGRMLTSGEDPLFISRRMIRFAAEDIGLADPQALIIANTAWDTYNRLGSPEGELALYQAVVYLATSPKSNALYMCESAVKSEIEKSGSLPVPFVIRNAPSKLMKELGYGNGYKYDHDFEAHFAPQKYLPDEIADKEFYQPGDFGFEKDIKKRLDWWNKKRLESQNKEKK